MVPVLKELGITLEAHSPDRTRRSPPGVRRPGHRVLAEPPGRPSTSLPGTTRVSHLLANVAAAHLDVDARDLERFDAASA